MSDFKNIVKGGWHPKGKDGGKESWRGDFKGVNQVAGWMGKGKTSGESAQSTHVSRPLASLKDPSSFGPPPKNVNYHGGAALPNEITPHRGGLGAPLTAEQTASARTATLPVEEEPEKPVKAAPPLPYRADRTGLRTDNLPPPPLHRDLNNTYQTQEQYTPKPTPGLPPRLPSRQNTATPPPPSYETATSNSAAKSSTPTLNQSAIDRLGNAGVSVPALGIGKSNSNNVNNTADTTSSWKPQQNQPSLGLAELQSRFSRMNSPNSGPNSNTSSTNAMFSQTTTSQPPESTSPQPQTPSWQQTRTALTTANSAYKDPSSVSLADAQAAAQTASNAQKSAVAFRERHQETISAAQTRASQINKRYNMTGRLNKFLEDANNAHDKREQEVTQQQQPQPQPQPQQSQQQYGHQPVQSPPIQQSSPNPWAMQNSQGQQPVASPPPQSSTPELQASISRKPPPPPPPKKPASMQAPPPVPLGTRPNFG